MFIVKVVLAMVGGILAVFPVVNKYLDSEDIGKGTVIITAVGTAILVIVAVLPN